MNRKGEKPMDKGMIRAEQRALLQYAKMHRDSFEKGGASSNEIRYFTYAGRAYVLKTPLMTGERLSPFWGMMRDVFGFTFEKQMAALPALSAALGRNPHIPAAKLAAAGEGMMIFERMPGTPWPADEFPAGQDNAWRLGQYIGYNHQMIGKTGAFLGTAESADFFMAARARMEACLAAHWNGDEETDRRMRWMYSVLRERTFLSSGLALIMTDISADQFLFDGEENLTACVDLDAYVVGPVEWELTILKNQVRDWERFRAGYEIYRPMPSFEDTALFFSFLMALNSYEHKDEITGYWARYLPL